MQFPISRATSTENGAKAICQQTSRITTFGAGHAAGKYFCRINIYVFIDIRNGLIILKDPRLGSR